MRPLIVVLALAPTLLSGCDRPAPGGAHDGSLDGWAGAVRDSAGVRIVMNPAIGLWAESEHWRVQEETRIGAVEGADGVQFGRIVGLARDQQGHIFVLDGHERNIRAFGPDGQLLYAVGRPGAAPGELSSAPAGLFVGPGDTLLVPDPLLGRVTWYADGGEASGSFLVFDLDGGVSADWRLHPDGVFWSDLSVPPRGPDRPWSISIVARDLHGTASDTLLTSGWSPANVGSGAYTLRLFAPRPVWGIGPGGRLLHGVSSEYRIHVQGDGRSERIITKPFEPQPVGRADAALLARRARSAIAAVGQAPLPLELDVSDGLPAIVDVRAGPNNTIWVQRGITTEQLARVAADRADVSLHVADFGSNTWDVFDEVGRYLGSIDLPHRFRLHSIHGDRLLGVRLDELDVEYVNILRLRTGALGKRDG